MGRKATKATEEGMRRGINWRLVLHTVGITIVVWFLGLTLSSILQNGFIIVWYMPAALVTILAYYRSEQKTRFQKITEAALTGALFMILVQLLTLLLGSGGQTGGQ